MEQTLFRTKFHFHQCLSMDKNKKEHIIKRVSVNKFIVHTGIEIHDISDGECELYINVEEHHEQQNGFLHGGMTATLIDVATGISAYSVAPEGKNVVTADLKVQYLHPATSNKIIAKGKVIKAGRFMVFTEAQIFDVLPEGNKLVAVGQAIMCLVDIPIKNQ